MDALRRHRRLKGDSVRLFHRLLVLILLPIAGFQRRDIRHVRNEKLRPAGAAMVIPPMHERGGFIVFDLGCLRRHDARKHLVHGVYNSGRASEIGVEVNSRAALPGAVARITLHEQAGLRHAEAVNGLLNVAHEEQAILPQDRGKDLLLHGVAVLIFIHENVSEAAAVFAGHGLILKKIEHLVFHVGIVDDRARRFCFRIALIKRGDGVIQFAQQWILRLKAGSLLRKRDGISILLRADDFLEIPARFFENILFRLIHAFPADPRELFKSRKRRGISVPRFMQQQPTRSENLPIEMRGKLGVILRDRIPQALQPVCSRSKCPAVPLQKLLHSGRSRKRFRRDAVLFHRLQEPGKRLRLGQRKIIDAEDQLRHVLFVPAERIHKRIKTAAFVRAAHLRSFIPRLLLHHERFRLIRNAKGGVEARFLKMAAQHLRAEGMQCGNVRARGIPCRRTQAGTRRFILRGVRSSGKPRFHTLFHLRRRSVRERNTEELTHRRALGNEAHEAFR